MRMMYLPAGARPNFMKVAPLVRALKVHDGLSFKIVHTGQHYDREMSGVFFEELGIPSPDVSLDAGTGSHAQQTAKIMVAFEEVCRSNTPDCVVVIGDVNSTLACAIVAKKMHIPVAHVEAGLRSGDMHMPEEINRVATDAIADWYFVSEPSGVENLLREGKPRERIFHVGNVMIDNLMYQRDQISHANTKVFTSTALKQLNETYGVVTLHRPSNVDDEEPLRRIATGLHHISERLPLIFSVHPRTRTSLDRFGIHFGERISLTGPLSYMDFLNLWKDARLVLTDSGGLQEECTALGVPCLTVRENTERPITVEQGTNVLVGTDPSRMIGAAEKVLISHGGSARRPALWDGNSAGRIVDILTTVLN